MAFDTTRIANGKHTIQVGADRCRWKPDLVGSGREWKSGTAVCRTGPERVSSRNSTPGFRSRHRAANCGRRGVWAHTVDHRRLSTPEGGTDRRCCAGRVATTGRPGSRAKVIGQVVTDGNGAFNFSPKAGSSRRITVSYRAYTLDAAASATSDVTLQTRAGVRLTVSPRRVSPRGAIRFTGRLLGGPGRAGTQVVIYALGGSRSRIPVATVRADSRGRFRYRYRFSNSAPGTTYRFQATLHAQRSYPYATGHSRTVAVRIK